MSNETILVINAGSSSIKFSLFECEKLSLIYHGEIEDVFTAPVLSIFDGKHKPVLKKSDIKPGYEPSIQAFFNWFESLTDNTTKSSWASGGAWRTRLFKACQNYR